MGLDPKGKPTDESWEPCLAGRYAPGVAVLLLPRAGSKTCAVVTGRVGKTMMDVECTVLSGYDRCGGDYMLGVVGARGGFRPLELRPVNDDANRRLLGQAISTSHVAETASSRWTQELEGRAVADTIVEALSLPGVEGGPRLVRLKIDGASIDGPWVTVVRGAPGTIIGPFSTQPPAAFSLDGHSYLHFDVAVCTGCGGIGAEVYAVENGQLRRVLKSFANAN